MPGFLQDLRHAVRVLAGHPGYSATALLTLALGIGFSTATFSVINAVLLKPLPYREPDRLLILRERNLPRFPEFSVSPGHYLTWRRNATKFEGIAAWGTQLVNLDTGSGEPERVRADRVSANLFPLLGIPPAVGRLFTEADDQEGALPVVVLSNGAWHRRFGGGDVIGQTVRMNRRPVTIVGVMPPDFAFPSPDTEMWVPLAMTAQERERYGNHYLWAVGRLQPGVTLDRARADLDAVAKGLETAMPTGSNLGWRILAFPMQQFYVRDVRMALLVLLGAVSMVLLIACVNVANLLLARGAARDRELAIRAAMGATRLRLVRQVLAEQVLLAAASAAAGVLVAAWLLRVLLALVPDALPRQDGIRLDAQVLGFAVLLAAMTPLVFGLLPAIQISRPELRELLAAGGRHTGGAPARRVRRALVVAEIALAMVLLVGAGLLIRSFGNLTRVSPGFDPSAALVASVNLPPDRYPQGASRERFFQAMLERTAALRQVAAAGLTQSVPMVNEFVSPLSVEGVPAPPEGNPTVNFYAVSPGYFDAMRIPLLRGRLFSDADRLGSPRVVVINTLLADRHFAGENPLGRRITVGQGDNSLREIVGVVGDVKQHGLGDPTPAQVYEPYLQHPYFSGFSLIVRTRGSDPVAVAPELRSIVRDLDDEVPLSRVRRLDDVVDGSIRPQRFSTTLIAIFSGAALLLAAVGVYGVMSYTVGLRRREFAIRVAHGARHRDILRLVVGGAASLAIAGVMAGLAAAWLMRRTMDNLLFGVTSEDRLTYLATAGLLIAVALAASAIPALRAARVDPAVALRAE